MKKLGLSALSLLYCASALGQVAIIGSTGQFSGNVSTTGNLHEGGGYSTQTAAGLWMAYGMDSSITGDVDFISNTAGGGSGGFAWYVTPSSGVLPTLPLMYMNDVGVLYAGGFNGPLTGNASTASAFNHTPSTCTGGQFAYGIGADGTPGCSGALTGSLNGNASTATALAGTPSTCATGSYAYGIGPTGTPGCSNNLIGTVTGNASTATALAASPTNCGSERYPSGINASGTAQNCGPQTLYGSTTSVCTTPSGAGIPGTNVCTTNVTWTNGSFSGGSYYAVCVGVNASGTTAPIIYISGKTSTYVTVSLMAGTASQAGAATYSEIDCQGMAP
jgi:hypothetical protein